MLVIALCVILVAAGVAAIVRQGQHHGGERGRGRDQPRRHARVHHLRRTPGRLRLRHPLCAATPGPARGRAGGAALGALLLVLAGTRIEPLRADNLDFKILGPAWLAVLSFTVLALFQGLLTAAFAERISAPPAPLSRTLMAGRIAVAAVALVALPGFVDAMAEIT